MEAKKKLSEFEGELFIKFQSAGYKGESEQEQWSFPGALLYAVTVISTIGKETFLGYFQLLWMITQSETREREITFSYTFRLRSHYAQNSRGKNCDHDIRDRGHAPVLFMDGANGRTDGQRLQGFVLQCVLWPLSKGKKA